MEALSQRLEATYLGAILKRQKKTEPTNSFPFQKLPNELKTLIIEACGSRFFTEDISRLLVSRLWYQMAVRVMYSDLVLSSTFFPWAWLRPIRQYFTPELAAVHEPGFCSVPGDRLTRLTRSCTFDLDSFFRRLNFEPEDGESWGSTITKATFSRGPWPFSAGVNIRISILDATAYVIPLLHVPRSISLTEFRLVMREAWGVHRRYNSFLESEIQQMLWSPGRESSIIIDAPGLGRRYNRWNQNTPHRDLDPEVSLWPYEDTWFVADGPSYEIRPRSLDENKRCSDFDRCHICPAVGMRLLATERLYLPLPSLCAHVLRPVRKLEERDLAHELWPEAEFLIDDHYDEFLEEMEAAGYTESPDSKADLPQVPKLKELVINMVVPPSEQFHHPRVVHCVTGGARLTSHSVHRYADLALETMNKEIGEFAQRCPNAERVLLRYEGTLTCTALEFNALTGETRELEIDRWGDVQGGESTFDA
jgi:hypothetical protein